MKKILELFRRHPKEKLANDPVMDGLLRAVSMTDEQELSCDEVFALLDQFAEMIKRGEDAARMMPMVQKHLGMCPDCREEYETLIKMLETPTKGFEKP
jgi:hypothetical protein